MVLLPEMRITDADFATKIFFLGGNSVGKSALLEGCLGGNFPCSNVKPTTKLAVREAVFSADVGDISSVGIQFYDAGGSVLKNYGDVMEQFYMGARGGFIVYDAHDEATFEEARGNASLFTHDRFASPGQKFLGRGVQTLVT